MTPREHVALAPLTTFRIGGLARFFIDCNDERELADAGEFARSRGLPLLPLGGGSNVLVPDDGVEAVVVHYAPHALAASEQDGDILLTADAGASWESVVEFATARGLWGVENLAGIPGSVGGACVQNIGAYGAELADTFLYADAIDASSGKRVHFDGADVQFGYRTSVFKHERSLVITRIALMLTKQNAPKLSYRDLARLHEAGHPLATPLQIAEAVRGIRARKFPDLTREGSAGSFFKNPLLSEKQVVELGKRFPQLPQFPQKSGGVRIPLAWLLDHVLALGGLAQGGARLYEKQPLVIVTREGASARDVDSLEQEVASRVLVATGIVLEREVESFGER